MPIDAGQDAPRSSEPQAINPVQVFTEAQQAIDTVKASSAVSVWEDYHIRDEYHPVFIAFFDPEISDTFDQKLAAAKNVNSGREHSYELERLEDEITALVAEYRGGQPLKIYKDGEWAVKPDEILAEEWDQKEMDDDYDWFEAQREGFRRMEEGDSDTSGNEPWRGELMDKAIEIARQDGRGHPEEADFNTATLLLGDKVPKNVREQLDRDLQAIEEGRSSGNR